MNKIIEYLIDNEEHLIEIIKILTKEKDELIEKHDSILKPLINEEYLSVCKQLISYDLALNGKFTPEEVMLLNEVLDVNNEGMIYVKLD